MHRSRERLAALGAALVVAVTGALAAPAAQALPPTGKQAVIDYLRTVPNTGIVSGQHNKEPASAPAQYTQQVHAITGKFPGLWGGELMFTSTDVANRQRVIDQAKLEWANGSLVALTWHVCPPTTGSSCAFEGGVKSRITDAQFREVVTEGTALNAAWKRRLDEVVPYLRQLQDAGVPAMFRPLHEMNETWNWWGGYAGPDGGAKLFRITRDHLERTRGLTNLVWVWNVQDNPAGNWSSYYPGAAYADVVSLDVWYKGHPSSADYQQIQTIAAGKPIAIAEMGKVPNATLLSAQPRWSYFMVWSEQLRGSNTDAEIRAAYDHPRVINQGEVTIGTRTGAITGLGGKCVDVAASGTANGTAVQLYTCAPGIAQTWSVLGDGSLRNPNSGRCLDPVSGGTANGTRVQLWDCNGTANQRWTHDPATGALRNAQSGRCLDVPGGSTADGTRLQIWDCTGGAAQNWRLPA